MNAATILEEAAAERATANHLNALNVRDQVRPLLRRRIRAAALALQLS